MYVYMYMLWHALILRVLLNIEAFTWQHIICYVTVSYIAYVYLQDYDSNLTAIRHSLNEQSTLSFALLQVFTPCALLLAQHLIFSVGCSSMTEG